MTGWWGELWNTGKFRMSFTRLRVWERDQQKLKHEKSCLFHLVITHGSVGKSEKPSRGWTDWFVPIFRLERNFSSIKFRMCTVLSVDRISLKAAAGQIHYNLSFMGYQCKESRFSVIESQLLKLASKHTGMSWRSSTCQRSLLRKNSTSCLLVGD